MAQDFNSQKVVRLAWARCAKLCHNSHHFPSLKPHQLYSRYKSCLDSKHLTEDIDFLFNRASLMAYAATKDFHVENEHGYLLAIFDDLLANFEPNNKALETKMLQGREAFEQARLEVKKMRERWDREKT